MAAKGADRRFSFFAGLHLRDDLPGGNPFCCGRLNGKTILAERLSPSLERDMRGPVAIKIVMNQQKFPIRCNFLIQKLQKQSKTSISFTAP